MDGRLRIENLWGEGVEGGGCRGHLFGEYYRFDAAGGLVWEEERRKEAVWRWRVVCALC